MALETQEIAPLRIVIVAEDTKDDCKVSSIHLVPFAM